MVQQKRSLYVKQFQAFDILKQKNIAVSEAASDSDVSVSVSVDRTALSPCIIASPSAEFAAAQTRKFPFSYTQETFHNSPLVTTVVSHLGLPESAHGELAKLVQALWEIFKEKEAFLLETRVCFAADGRLEVRGTRFGFDDAAFRSSGRQEEIHSLRDTAEEVPEEVEAEKDGIVYVKYVGQPRQASDNADHRRLQGEGSTGTLGISPNPPHLPTLVINTFSSERSRSCYEHSRRAHHPWRPLRQLPRHRWQSHLRNSQIVVPDYLL